MSICRYTCSLLAMLCISLATMGQADQLDPKDQPPQPEPEVQEPRDTSIHYKPTGFRLGTDVISLVKSQMPGHTYTGWELNGDIDFHRTYLAVDFGHSARNLPMANGTYENSGTYYRVGVDINFLKKDPEKNMFYLGFRYGTATYDERLTFSDTVKGYNTVVVNTRVVENAILKSNWAEIVTGVKFRIWKELWMGYTARMKFFPSLHKELAFTPYDIPGYGLTYKRPWWGINYQIFWRIPFGKPKYSVNRKSEK